MIKTITHQFHALGTTVQGGWRTEPAAAQAIFLEIQRRIVDFETRFSRFTPDSELSRLNTQAGPPVAVSETMMDILLKARKFWQQTDGLVDPTVGRAVIAAGYDVSFELLPDGISSEQKKVAVTKSSFADVHLDQMRKTVTLPAGMLLDFGGLGKGYLVDSLVPDIEKVTTDYWLSLGGDLIVSGTGDDNQPWSVGIQDPRSPERDFLHLRPPPGHWGLATSGTIKRHGVRAGVPWHHLIDPRTGQPSVSDVIAATVLAPTALEADVMAKVVLLRGSIDGIAWASAHGVEALAVAENGRLEMTPSIKQYFVHI